MYIKTQDYTPSLKWSTNLKKMTNDKEKRIKRQDGDYDKVYITRREGGAGGGRGWTQFQQLTAIKTALIVGPLWEPPI